MSCSVCFAAMCSAGRSTTELVFVFKLLAKKAITSSDCEFSILMSKAFDTIQSGTLLEDLKEILTIDELNLIHLLLNDVQLAVKLEDKIGKLFESRIGSPQGNAASALFYIIYLAVALIIAKKEDAKAQKTGPSKSSLSITTRKHHQTTISA